METHGNSQAHKIIKRKISDPDIHHLASENSMSVNTRSPAISIPERSDGTIRKNSTSESNGNNLMFKI